MGLLLSERGEGVKFARSVSVRMTDKSLKLVRHQVTKARVAPCSSLPGQPFSLETKTGGLLNSEIARMHEALAQDVLQKVLDTISNGDVED
ncbi:hypothetical protein GQ600_27304 [Phytophthora cactorum]|nr:hypothetical protein GQ600_27304 [Phytophthora cactorum]